MRQVVVTPKFRRAYRKYVSRDQRLKRAIDETLLRMQEDLFAPFLSAHKLSGQLMGLWACSCGYDCRIVFVIEYDEQTKAEVILLLDIGTHDEVY